MRSITSRTVKIGASWIVWSVAAAAAGQVLPDAIQACKSEQDNARRLQCYDREVAKFPMTTEQGFGLSESAVAVAQHKSSGAAPEVKHLTAKVVAITERPHAGFVATLDNGQIWVQNEMESLRVIDVGDMVTIKPGMLGSFWLVGPSGRRTKAHRVQ
jgi:hypothetical protein